MQEDGTTIRAIPTEEYFARVRRQLSEEGYAYVRVTGVSMQPLLRHLRDGVVLIPPELIKRGDIVLFDRKNGRYALHRVIRKGKNGFMMAGDNQWHYETNLSYDQIVGVASEIVRGEKRIPCSNFFLIAHFRLSEIDLLSNSANSAITDSINSPSVESVLIRSFSNLTSTSIDFK